MPLLQNGIYAANDERPYEAETTYYLNFHILSALYSIERLYHFEASNLWENKYQYYHYYSDHLLFCIGQIANRLVLGNSKGIRREKILNNRGNYRFSENAYPILSSKNARNVIEHIDERNRGIINKQKGVGGFNVIDSDASEELVKSLRRTDLHPYILDILNNELLIRDDEIDLKINLNSLKAELESLREAVQYFKEIANQIL